MNKTPDEIVRIFEAESNDGETITADQFRDVAEIIATAEKFFTKKVIRLCEQFENGNTIIGYADSIYYVEVGKEIHQYTPGEMLEIYNYKS